MYSDQLDYSLVSDAPAPLYMGELPRRYDEIPAKIVVNMCGVYPGGEPWGRVVLGMPMLDVLDPELIPERAHFERFLQSVHLYASEMPSYWHCHAGLNRSGLAIAAYLHVYRGLRISDAITRMRAERSPMVLCNSLFEQTLRRWYGGPDEQAFEAFSLEKYLVERHGSR